MLFEKLESNNRIPMHMPGHKRNTTLLGKELPYNIDITEIDGFDNLHAPKGILAELENKLRVIYSSKQSIPLVNGSTVGILAAITSTVKSGDCVLMARNCHKSVYNAVELARAKAEYIIPEYDEYGIAKGISPEAIKLGIERHNPKLLVLTSPTYEGVMSDIDAICELAHSYNIPVLIDAAHGAHMFDSFKSADIVIMSLHKTLPALTQCSVANIYGDLIDIDLFRIKLSVFETSSPSYVLLASIDKCADFIINSKNLFKNYNDLLSEFYDIKLINLKVLCYDDLGKIIVFTGDTNISGVELSDMLRKDFNIEVEMASRDYIIAMTSVCDREENIFSLRTALETIDSGLKRSENGKITYPALPEKSYNHSSAITAMSLDCCKNMVCAEYIWLYPPGVPVICPGEIMSEHIINYLCANIGLNIQSTYTGFPEKIRCYLTKN